jgi:hypothetical protein
MVFSEGEQKYVSSRQIVRGIRHYASEAYLLTLTGEPNIMFELRRVRLKS